MNFEYQEEGARFLANGGILLADDPGLGKSRQALRAAELLQCQTILVQCPAIAVGVWLKEVGKWLPDWQPFAVRDLIRQEKPRVPRRKRVLIVSYDLVVRNVRVYRILMNFEHDMLICDEAHQLKSIGAKRTILTYGPGATGGEKALISRCKHIKILTGTPQLNHVGEMFPHLRALAPERLDRLSHDGFVAKYCVRRLTEIPYMDRNGKRKIKQEWRTVGSNKPTVLGELIPAIKGFGKKRTVEQVLGDLPPLRIDSQLLTTEVLDTEILKKLEKSPAAKEIIDVINSGGNLGELQALEDSMSRVRRLMALAKVTATIEWVYNALDGGEPKVAVWGWHTEALRQIHAELKKAELNPIYIDGSIDKRDPLVEKFETDPTCRTGVFQIQAAGTALTMTACRRIVMFEQAWTPPLNWQAIKRHHRIGSTDRVLAEILMAPGVDEVVSELLAKKMRDIAVTEMALLD